MTSYVKLFDSAEMDNAVCELARQISSHFCDTGKEFALVGIHQLGVPLAQRLHDKLLESGIKSEIGMLDITMYRDDIGTRNMLPRIHETIIPFDVNDRVTEIPKLVPGNFEHI